MPGCHTLLAGHPHALKWENFSTEKQHRIVCVDDLNSWTAAQIQPEMRHTSPDISAGTESNWGDL